MSDQYIYDIKIPSWSCNSTRKEFLQVMYYAQLACEQVELRSSKIRENRDWDTEENNK